MADLHDSSPVDTPVEVNLKLSKDDGDLLPDPQPYRRRVGSLVYLTITRPDISYAVNLVSQFMTAPRHLHLVAVKRIIRYLLRTIPRGLYYPKDNPLHLTAYADADWAGCQDTPFYYWLVHVPWKFSHFLEMQETRTGVQIFH